MPAVFRSAYQSGKDRTRSILLPTQKACVLTGSPRRYPEDVYDGTGTSLGNPWYLTTAAMAELFYRTTLSFRTAGRITVTDVSLPFWTYFAPSSGPYTPGTTYDGATLNSMLAALEGWADAFMRRVKHHTPVDGRLAEEFNRDDGHAQGAADLTWSYAALLTAAFARAEVAGQLGYVAQLADLGLSSRATG